MFGKYTTILTILRWLVILAISSPSLCVFAPLCETDEIQETAFRAKMSHAKTSHAKTQRPQRQERFADSSFPIAVCHSQHTYVLSSYFYTDY
jgi:hypothetical protein